jgi:hypothetical protein
MRNETTRKFFAPKDASNTGPHQTLDVVTLDVCSMLLVIIRTEEQRIFYSNVKSPTTEPRMSFVSEPPPRRPPPRPGPDSRSCLCCFFAFYACFTWELRES